MINYSRQIVSILNKNGDEKIVKMQIYRKPLSSFTKMMLNITSYGEFNKRVQELPYDNIYHLFLTLELENGNKFLLEKNETISLKPFSNNPDGESISISIKDTVSLNSLLTKTKAYMGGKFMSYSGYDNNCQTFIDAILQSNGLHSNESKAFIVQDTKHLFKNDDQSDNDKFRKVVNTVTDVANLFSQSNNLIDQIKENPRSISELPQNDLLKTIGEKITNLPKEVFNHF